MSDCVEWQGERRMGYGLIYLGRVNGRRVREYAHRAFFLLYNGPIPRGHHVHHECRNRLCVNPAHLRAVPPGEHVGIHGSVRAAIAASVARRAAITHCPQGHAYDDANTYRNPVGARQCRACARERARVRHGA